MGQAGNMKVVIKGSFETGYPTLTMYKPNPVRKIDGVDEIIYNVVYRN